MDVAKSTLKVYLAEVGTAVLSFLGIIVFARILNASSLGLFFLFQAVVYILAMVADFGLQGAIEKRISENKCKAEFAGAGILLTAIFTSFVSILIWVFKSELNSYFGLQSPVLIIIGVFLHNYFILIIKIMSGELHVGDTAILRFGRSVLWFLGGLILVWLWRKNASALIISWLVATSVVTVAGFYFVETELAIPAITHLESTFSFSIYNFVSSAEWQLYNWVDIVVIGYFVSQAAVGAYEVAWRLTSVVVLLSQSISMTIFPKISELHSHEKYDEISELVKASLSPAILLIIPGFGGAVVLSTDLLNYLFGNSYATASVALSILMGGRLFQAFQGVFGVGVRGINRPDLSAISNFIALLTNIAMNILLVWKFGIVGAAVATSISVATNCLLHFYFLQEYVPIIFPIKQAKWMTVSTIIMCSFLLLLKSITPVHNAQTLIAFVFAGALIYISTLFASSEMRRETISVWRTLS